MVCVSKNYWYPPSVWWRYERRSSALYRLCASSSAAAGDAPRGQSTPPRRHRDRDDATVDSGPRDCRPPSRLVRSQSADGGCRQPRGGTASSTRFHASYRRHRGGGINLDEEQRRPHANTQHTETTASKSAQRRHQLRPVTQPRNFGFRGT